MPEFVLNRDFVLRSLNGHIITFKKGEPVWVPPVCVKEAVGIGAACVDGDVDVIGDTPEKSVVTGKDRETALTDAFDILVERNGRGDFTGQGIPAAKAVERLVGFEVSRQEIETAWRARAEQAQ